MHTSTVNQIIHLCSKREWEEEKPHYSPHIDAPNFLLKKKDISRFYKMYSIILNFLYLFDYANNHSYIETHLIF